MRAAALKTRDYINRSVQPVLNQTVVVGTEKLICVTHVDGTIDQGRTSPRTCEGPRAPYRGIQGLPPAVARIPDSRQLKGLLVFQQCLPTNHNRVIHVRPQPLKTTSAETPAMRTKITIQCRHHYLSKA